MISVVIVNYNTPDLVNTCIDSFIKFHSTYEFEIIVVDNSSSPSDEAKIKTSHPDVIWQQMGYNSGFSRANNKGFDLAKGEYIMMVNSDIVFTNDLIDPFLSKLKENSNLMLGCRLLNEDGSLQKSVYHYNASYSEVIGQNFIMQKLGWKLNQKQIKALSGALLFFKADMLKVVGKMDEQFFMYSEEFEWQRRAMDKGIKLEHIDSSSVIHLIGGSSQNSTNFQRYISVMLLFRKVHGFIGLIILRWLICQILMMDIFFYLFYSKEGKLNTKHSIRYYFRSIGIYYKMLFNGQKDYLYKYL